MEPQTDGYTFPEKKRFLFSNRIVDMAHNISTGRKHMNEKTLKNSVALITGGTGSFGHKVATHMLKLGPREVRIYSRDEKKQWEMQREYPDLRYIIGDVRDYDRLNDAMRGVDFVFHAAALKQVPSCESYPYEAVKTNIIGSQNVCQSARVNHVQTVVALSTDKAVKPVNAMGLSKAMMEKIICSQNQLPGETVFCCTRYGNVMGSRGSVIPLFREQIAAASPMTITVPYMTRFLMTLDESVYLVFHALLNARGGEVFVRKAPACSIQALAETMAQKYSPRGVDHPICGIGIRAGEKIHEVLVNEYEMQRVEETPEYFAIYPGYCVPRALTPQALGTEYTSENTRQLTTKYEIGAMLDRMGVVEEYI
jgi:UDP-N-acetylglucosamine 4,6-dehydratase/5-epimerase